MVEEEINYSGVMVSKKSTLLKSGSKVAIFFMLRCLHVAAVNASFASSSNYFNSSSSTSPVSF